MLQADATRRGDYRKDPSARRPQHRREGLEFWRTTACLIAGLIRDVEPSLPAGPIWESACGDGAVVRPLEAAGRVVIATDIATGTDFLCARPPRDDFAAIVTNPPHSQKLLNPFIHHGLDLLDQGCTQSLVLLLRFDHLQSRGRLWRRASAIYLSAWRPRWIKGSTGSPRWHYAWVKWLADDRGPPRLIEMHRPGDLL